MNEIIDEIDEVFVPDENTPEIYVEFSIWGEQDISVGIDKIAELINIPTAEIMKIGDKTRYFKNRLLRFDCWQIKTEERQTYEIEEEIKKLIVLLQDKKEIINYIHDNFNHISIGFCVIVTVNNGRSPFFRLSKETLQFMSDIRAYFDIDLYVNSWNGDD
ncbi:MAG: DUF4279 domain-containing protein [Neisseriaceae bacterium]|nr:DUF4279 domain-containing protein [Neisseriaceae bacterium]